MNLLSEYAGMIAKTVSLQAFIARNDVSD